MIYANSSISALSVAEISRFVPLDYTRAMVWLGQIAWKAPSSNLPRLLHETGTKTDEISDNFDVETLPPFSPLKYSQNPES